MRPTSVFSKVCAFLLASLLIASCTFPATTSEDFQLYFGRPQDGDVIMLGESFQLLANGLSTAGEVSRVLYFVDGRVVAEAPNTAGTTIVTSYTWTPAAAGQYTLQLAAQRGSQYAYSEVLRVCVLPFQIAPGHPFDIYAHGYQGDCQLPERSAAARPGTPTVTLANANPASLTYVPFFYETCPEQTRFVDFQLNLDDPNDDIVFAAIAINIAPAQAGRINAETTLAMTRLEHVPAPAKIYIGYLDLRIFLARSLTNPETSLGLDGELRWTARAFGRDGEILLEEGPFSIPAVPVSCDGTLATPAALPVEPALTGLPEITVTLETLPQPTFTPQLTATPASARDCPPGTYYSEITQKCYQVAIPTATLKPNQPEEQNSCSQYDSYNACVAAGCSYNLNTKTCE